MDTPNFLLSEALIEDSIRNAVNYYGIEGCEEAICRVYTQNPTLKARFMQTFNRIYKKNN